MPAYLLDRILKRGQTGGYIQQTAAAQNWYRSQARRTVASSTTLLNSSEDLRTSLEVGNLYLFQYDPKLKKTLPYYDRFPMVVPFKRVGTGFMGLNLHYLPLGPRAKLLDALHNTISNERYDKSTKFRIAYSLLKGASSFKYFEPCLKHYLLSHVQSKFLYIQPKYWDIAAFLPLQSFEKAGVSRVYRESLSKVG